jgi:hypothetical protein
MLMLNVVDLRTGGGVVQKLLKGHKKSHHKQFCFFMIGDQIKSLTQL